jgi:hypothetical protein
MALRCFWRLLGVCICWDVQLKFNLTFIEAKFFRDAFFSALLARELERIARLWVGIFEVRGKTGHFGHRQFEGQGVFNKSVRARRSGRSRKRRLQIGCRRLRSLLMSKNYTFIICEKT